MRAGEQMVHQRFTGGEQLALIEIVKAQKRVRWSKVAQELEERGFPKRTPKSVRNHHLRWRQATSSGGGTSKNVCRKCGRPQRGHVCEIADEAPASVEAACVVVKE